MIIHVIINSKQNNCRKRSTETKHAITKNKKYATTTEKTTKPPHTNKTKSKLTTRAAAHFFSFAAMSVILAAGARFVAYVLVFSITRGP